MSEGRMDSIVEQLRSNLRSAGIGVGTADIDAMVSGGYLRPVQAFEQATADLAMDLVPEYLGAWGQAGEEEGGETAAPAFHVGLPPHHAGVREAGSDPLDLGILEVSAFVRKGELSPVELVRGSLDRIEERGELLNAFQLLLASQAMEAARHAEREISSGSWRGFLHGLPVAVKDILDLAGTPTTAGSRILAGRVVPNDSTAVARLRHSGAVIVGKTRMSEFAYSPGSNNDHYGPTRNPRGLERDTGGSSSGSAAATADGMVYAALGTDTGGSIRIPAAFCGLVGFKPTWGLLSLKGSVSLAWSLDHLGPLARNVVDAAILLDAVSGYDPLDPRTRRVTGLDSAFGAALRGDEGLKGLRVGVLRDDGSGRSLASEAGLGAWKRGLSALEAAGASLIEVDLPELQSLRSLNSTILAIEAATFHLPMLRSRLADYGDFMRLRILAGWAYGPTDFIRAQQGLLVLRHSCDEIFESVDLLSTPTMPGEAPALGTPARLTFTSPFNLLGWPALSLPAGQGPEGLPLGMQLVGKPWDDATVLRAARAAELALLGQAIRQF